MCGTSCGCCVTFGRGDLGKCDTAAAAAALGAAIESSRSFSTNKEWVVVRVVDGVGQPCFKGSGAGPRPEDIVINAIIPMSMKLPIKTWRSDCCGSEV